MSEPLAVAAPLQQLEEQIELWAQRAFTDEPFTKLVGLITTGAAIFYRAEVGKNPKVKTYLDALVFVSTSASVGYCDIFAMTPVGKAVASLVMTIGPAMASAAFTGGAQARNEEAAAHEARDREMLETMKQILAELKKQGAGSEG